MKDLAVLNEFTNDELEVLVELIIDKGSLTETLSVDDTYKACHPDHICYVELIKKELTEFGGNTFMNIVRGEGVAYREILIDVCKKTKTPFNEKASLERIENALLEKVLEDAWDKMSDAEREELLKGGAQNSGRGGFTVGALIAIFRAGGFASYQLALIIANTIAKAIIGRGLPLVANAAIGRGLALLTGPIGWVLTALWTALDLAGPAYRVTIPAVIYIAALRQVHQSEQYKNFSF